MFLWDYFVSFFKDDSESEEDCNKNSEDVDMYTNSVHKLKLFAFLSKKDGADFNAIDSSGIVYALQWQEQLRLVMLKL